jgi:hypothetical protein
MEFLNPMHGARCPVDHVPKAKAAVSCGLEALILAQSDLPTAGALNLMIKWEKVVLEGKSDAFLCCTCILENCVVSSVVIRV